MLEAFDFMARAGGGGSSGGGGGGTGLIAIVIVVAGSIISWHRRRQRIKRAAQLQKIAQATDPNWNQATIDQRVREVFYAFQQDWSNFATENMRRYLTPRFHNHISLMMVALYQMQRRNIVGVELKSITLFDVKDSIDNQHDKFSVEIRASAHDQLQDTTTSKNLYASSDPFTEIWHFSRDGDQWLLDSITQVNSDKVITNYNPVTDKKYSDFADRNQFFYNADFGWLLLPLHGLLFSGSSFGRSDVNHHVIGGYHGRVVQFFEYLPLVPGKARWRDHLRHIYKRQRSNLATYTIAHVLLPKSYGNIIVERRPLLSLFSFKPFKMTKISLEWQQFNKLFNVFATDMEKVTSLELLHPKFMQDLADLKFRVSLEIIDNNLYLYTTDKKADYNVMLKILQDAFEEMKM